MQLLENLLLTVGWAVGTAGIVALMLASKTLSKLGKNSSAVEEKNG